MSVNIYPHYYNQGIETLKLRTESNDYVYNFNQKPSGKIPTDLGKCICLLNNVNNMLDELMINEESKDQNKQKEMIKEIKGLLNQSQQDLSKELDKKNK